MMVRRCQVSSIDEMVEDRSYILVWPQMANFAERLSPFACIEALRDGIDRVLGMTPCLPNWQASSGMHDLAIESYVATSTKASEI